MIAPIRSGRAGDLWMRIRTDRLARATSWSFVGIATWRLSQVVCALIAARYLVKSDFGVLGIVQSTIAMFQVLATLGMGATATKFVAELRVTDPERAGRVATLATATAGTAGALMMLAVWAFGSPLASIGLGRAQIAPLLMVSAPALLGSAMVAAQTGVLAGLDRFSLLAGVHASGALASMLLMFMLVRGWGVRGAVLSIVLSSAIQGLVGGWLVRRASRTAGVHGGWRSAWSERRIILEFSLPATLASCVTTPALWVSNAVLVRTADGLTAMGALTAASHWFSLLAFLPLVVAQPLLASISGSLASGETDRARQYVARASLATGAVACILGIAASLLSRPIMRLYGASFVGDWPVLVIMAIAGVLFAMQSPYAQFIVASGRMWLGFAMNVAWGIAVVGLSAALAPWSAAGVALARAVAYLLHVGWTVLAYRAICAMVAAEPKRR